MNYSDGKIPTMRPLEGERATKWRGGAVRQEPQMTLPQAGRRLAVRALFWPICPSGNDCMLPADIVISSGETRRYGWQRLWALMKRRVERPPATMWRATFRREISPLRSASVEMTGAGHRFGQFGPLRMTVCCLPLSSSRAGLPVVMSDRYSSLLKR